MKTNKRGLFINPKGKIEGSRDPNQQANHKRKTPAKRKSKTVYNTMNIGRARKRAVNRALRSMSGFLDQLFAKPTRKYFGFNKVFWDNVQNAVTGEHPRFKVDYSKIILSKGVVPLPPDLSVSSPNNGELVFRWKDDSGIEKALATDEIFTVAIHQKTGGWIAALLQASRKDRRCTMDVEIFRHHPVWVYIGFLSPDRSERSNSFCAGIVNIL